MMTSGVINSPSRYPQVLGGVPCGRVADVYLQNLKVPESTDVLRLLPLLETGKEPGTVVGSREFTEFALQREIELLETEKQKLEWLITLNLSLKSHENLCRFMSAIVQETAHSMIGYLMSAQILQQNITPKRLLIA
jgi:hypothetical protein